VSQRFARSKGLEDLSQFMIFPVSGQAQMIDEDPDNAYTCDSIEGEQYWWTNRYDEAMDLHRGNGGEIRMGDEEDRSITMATEGSATLAEIAERWRALLQTQVARSGGAVQGRFTAMNTGTCMANWDMVQGLGLDVAVLAKHRSLRI
jgi:hypothetical protein